MTVGIFCPQRIKLSMSAVLWCGKKCVLTIKSCHVNLYLYFAPEHRHYWFMFSCFGLVCFEQECLSVGNHYKFPLSRWRTKKKISYKHIFFVVVCTVGACCCWSRIVSTKHRSQFRKQNDSLCFVQCWLLQRSISTSSDRLHSHLPACFTQQFNQFRRNLTRNHFCTTFSV